MLRARSLFLRLSLIQIDGNHRFSIGFSIHLAKFIFLTLSSIFLMVLDKPNRRLFAMKLIKISQDPPQTKKNND